MAGKRVLYSLACLSGLAAGNFVSPGLGKCLDIKRDLKADKKTRYTLKEMVDKDMHINVQLYTCHGDRNQHYEITNGTFRSWAIRDYCLTADKISANSNVHLVKCDGRASQQWDFTGEGYVKMAGSDQCLDVVAQKKEDGKREVWHEIKKHKVVNVHLYNCHDAKTTKRVNQLWAWMPFQNGKFVGAEEKFELGDLGFSQSSPSLPALAALGAVAFFSLGAFIGLRARRASPVALSTLEE